jgi:hypothetical protein
MDCGWVQIGRNVTDAMDGILTGKRYLIHDRDPLFTAEFQEILAGVGVTSVKLPPQSPNLTLTQKDCAFSQRVVLRTLDAIRRELIAHRGSRVRSALQVRFIMPIWLCCWKIDEALVGNI